MPEPQDLDPRRRRLVYRALHRGTKEADLMIGGFVTRNIAGFTEAELGEIEALLEHWDVIESESKKAGHVADRSKWRLMGPMHIAETFEQAREDVRYGMCLLENYREHINPGLGIDWDNCDRAVDQLNESGAAVIGTPEMARAQINRLIEKSGGFGCYMIMGVDWARHDATLRSHQLIAEEVIPYFRGTNRATLASYDEVMGTGFEGAEITARAQEAMSRVYAQSK